jgi:hypothetical protein
MVSYFTQKEEKQKVAEEDIAEVQHLAISL